MEHEASTGPLPKNPASRRGACRAVRRRRALALLLAAAFATAAFRCAAANGNDAAAQCEALVSERIKSGAANSAKDESLAQPSYQAHYNQRLGRCFYLETTRQQTRSPAFKRILRRDTLRLWDIDQEKSLAEFDGWQDTAPLTCWVQGMQCKSKKEWDKLVRPYMKE